ncbi:glycoside hydrolase domain-containing protein [Runella zeae]|uniref:glycoside hydrolase domain-containing protein n=1 Tax=Runella zeae TaxID=94255 RepID=UPI0023551F67|nr:glycoside hydrolase domain-containing protein [Runella zeae]
MKSIIPFFTFLCFAFGTLQAQIHPYAVATTPWQEDYGNHRVVISVSQPTEAVYTKIQWRRRDANPQEKRLLITDENGKEITNIHRIRIDNEVGEFVFEPTKAGVFFVYYMPFAGKKNVGWWDGKYLTPENKPNQAWVEKHRLLAHDFEAKSLPQAPVLKIESRTAFDSFYPMEVGATQAERTALIEHENKNFLLFPEDRKFPVRMTENIPYRWVAQKSSNVFNGKALRNEYYAFQIAVFAAKKELKNLKVTFSGSNKVTCFNTGGIDADGHPFTKKVDVAQGKIQPLWFGVDISPTEKLGKQSFDVTISAENEAPQTMKVIIDVINQQLPDRGDSEPWRHSRLRWLNSTLGIDDQPVAPYTALKRVGKKISYLMGEVSLNESGFPESMRVNQQHLLRNPLVFVVETEAGVEKITPSSLRFTKNNKGVVSWVAEGKGRGFNLYCDGSMEFDGTLLYNISLKTQMSLNIKDVRLGIPVEKTNATYFMGMGLPGGFYPADYQWKWKGPQDSYWVGSVKAGLQCEMLGADYTGPLLNLYHPAPPSSWYNDNKGGFRLSSTGNQTIATTYSGERTMNAGESLDFGFRLLLTPVKKQDTYDQFANRYYHDGNKPAPSLKDLASGIKITNVHHANPINPYINYPFIAVDSMKNFVDYWHSKGLKVKIYYTIRELTNQLPELWALRSLGDEIFADGKGGGFPWLREHLVEHYDVQWFNKINGYEECDAAIRTGGKSRWYNYYINGLQWLVKNVDIDGLYLDDVAFDRTMLKRMRKVMNAVKPGCLLDLHSNTGFSKGPANQYTEYFPYINKLWFGESFNYDKMSPENWMVEVSGIPFGHMGDMLHSGGNPWRGMVYGMTVRYPWFTEGVSCDPRDIWKIWDEFDIAHAQMSGYWEENCPIKTDHEKVLATAYVHQGKTLISVASWAPETVKVKLNIDWKAIGMDPAKVKFRIPTIKNFQQGQSFSKDDFLEITPTKGFLLIVE